MEQALEDDMAKLSLQEQEKVLFDVHGIAQFDDDPEPAVVEKALEDLQKELDKTPHRTYYDLARAANPSYVEGRSFRLMFLRSSKFDPKGAACMLESHFKNKYIAFEELPNCDEIMGRDVRLSDLTPEDLAVLRNGHYQIFPERDAAGRSIFTKNFNAKFPPGTTRFNVARSDWYVAMSLMQDEEDQKKGVVCVLYHMEELKKDDNLLLAKMGGKYAHLGVPDRVVGAHFCFSHESVRTMATGLQLILNESYRRRFRTHFNSLDVIHFELQTYGIPADQSPMRPDTTWSTQWHLEWLEMQKNQEEMKALARSIPMDSLSGNPSSVSAAPIAEISGTVIVPHRFDVLFGKSKKEKESTGNMRALHLVEINRDKYEVANKFEKTEIAEKIVNSIHESGGRFLKKDKAGWIEVEHTAAREKISHFFRQGRVKTKRGNDHNEDSEGNDHAEAIKRTFEDATMPSKRAFTRTENEVTTPSKLTSYEAEPTATTRVTPTASPVHLESP